MWWVLLSSKWIIKYLCQKRLSRLRKGEGVEKAKQLFELNSCWRCLLLEHQQMQNNFREALGSPLPTVSSSFISGLSSPKCLLINYKEIQGKQVQEKLCSRLESAQKYLCVKHEQVRMNFFSYTWEGLKVGKGRQVPPEPKPALFGNAFSQQKAGEKSLL